MSNERRTRESILSKLKMPRPGQLLALCALALLLGVLVFAALPNGVENLLVGAYKDWLMCKFAVLGLVIDLVVNHRSRPGSLAGEIRVHAEYRRAVIIVGTMLAGGLAL